MEIQARESGICPARREVYSELMDEMIRQIALTGPETGALMVQIRDEINMSLSGYETIVASASGFGSLKALEAELGKEGKRDEVKQKQVDVDKNKKEISELKVITLIFIITWHRIFVLTFIQKFFLRSFLGSETYKLGLKNLRKTINIFTRYIEYIERSSPTWWFYQFLRLVLSDGCMCSLLSPSPYELNYFVIYLSITLCLRQRPVSLSNLLYVIQC